MNHRDAWTAEITRKQMHASLAKKANKYGAKKVVDGDLVFDSKKEFNRWRELQLREKAGEIKGLERQVEFPLNASAGEETVGYYRCDFEYLERRDDDWYLVVEDVKGMRTALYRWKAKHFKAQYKLQILET